MKDCILTLNLKFLAFKMCLKFIYSKVATFLVHFKKKGTWMLREKLPSL